MFSYFLDLFLFLSALGSCFVFHSLPWAAPPLGLRQGSSDWAPPPQKAVAASLNWCPDLSLLAGRAWCGCQQQRLDRPDSLLWEVTWPMASLSARHRRLDLDVQKNHYE